MPKLQSKTKSEAMPSPKLGRRQLSHPNKLNKLSKPTKLTKPSKQERIIKLLRRSKGASITELCEISNWQAHSVRGFLSGTIKKRLGLKLQSETDRKGTRRYKIVETQTSSPISNASGGE